MGTRDEWDSYRLYDDVSIFNKTFSIDLGQGQTITDIVCPLTIQVDSFANWDEPSTISSDLYGLRILVAAGATPAGNSSILRLEPNTNAATINSAFEVPVGGGGDLNYFFTLNPATGISAWGDTWLKIKVGGADKWITLSSTQP